MYHDFFEVLCCSLFECGKTVKLTIGIGSKLYNIILIIKIFVSCYIILL